MNDRTLEVITADRDRLERQRDNLAKDREWWVAEVERLGTLAYKLESERDREATKAEDWFQRCSQAEAQAADNYREWGLCQAALARADAENKRLQADLAITLAELASARGLALDLERDRDRLKRGLLWIASAPLTTDPIWRAAEHMRDRAREVLESEATP